MPLFGARFKTRHLPRPDGTCGWTVTAPEPGPATPLTSSIEADAVVVGAGFTGLAVARRLAELLPDGRIALVDALRAGDGASGRSSGFVVDMAYFTAVMSPRAAQSYVRLARAGIDELARRVETGGIDCDWDDTGWLHVAASEAGIADLTVLGDWLEARGERHEVLGAEQLREVLGTGFYRRGVRLPGRPLLHPAKLVRGLVRDLPENVELYEATPVVSERRRRGLWEVTTAGGSITAPRLLLATNGYSPAVGVLRDRVFPLLTYGSFTPPLADDQAARLGGTQHWGVLAQDPLGSTLRRLADGRLLVRNTLAYSPRLVAPGAWERARATHRRSLAARFPELYPDAESVELEHTWGGVMGATPVRASYFGEVAPGAWATAGFTGAGIALGTTAGRLLAERSCGHDSDLGAALEALPMPPRLPPDPFRSLGIQWRVQRMNAAAGEIP